MRESVKPSSQVFAWLLENLPLRLGQVEAEYETEEPGSYLDYFAIPLEDLDQSGNANLPRSHHKRSPATTAPATSPTLSYPRRPLYPPIHDSSLDGLHDAILSKQDLLPEHHTHQHQQRPAPPTPPIPSYPRHPLYQVPQSLRDSTIEQDSLPEHHTLLLRHPDRGSTMLAPATTPSKSTSPQQPHSQQGRSHNSQLDSPPNSTVPASIQYPPSQLLSRLKAVCPTTSTQRVSSPPVLSSSAAITQPKCNEARQPSADVSASEEPSSQEPDIEEGISEKKKKRKRPVEKQHSNKKQQSAIKIFLSKPKQNYEHTIPLKVCHPLCISLQSLHSGSQVTVLLIDLQDRLSLHS